MNRRDGEASQRYPTGYHSLTSATAPGPKRAKHFPSVVVSSRKPDPYRKLRDAVFKLRCVTSALLQTSPKCDLTTTGLDCRKEQGAPGTLKPLVQGEQSRELLAKRRQFRMAGQPALSQRLLIGQ